MKDRAIALEEALWDTVESAHNTTLAQCTAQARVLRQQLGLEQLMDDDTLEQGAYDILMGRT
jgi:hypothetical protein